MSATSIMHSVALTTDEIIKALKGENIHTHIDDRWLKLTKSSMIDLNTQPPNEFKIDRMKTYIISRRIKINISIPFK